MRKNGSRLISIRQYRLTDLFLFAAILVAAELLAFYAPRMFSGSAAFTFSLMVPIVLIVMMRWGWPSVLYAVFGGALVCLLGKVPGQTYAVYIIGNACISVMLLATKFFGKEKIAGKWYFSALFVVLGWLAVFLGRAIVSACFGFNFVSAIVSQLWDLLSLAMGVIVILVMRKLDGMFEDQKHYLKRLDAEKKEKARRDTFGDEPIEIDEESLSILNKKDDSLY